MASPVKYDLVWTEPALCDLERIDRYLRRRNPAAAKKLGEGLLSRVEVLKLTPSSGGCMIPICHTGCCPIGTIKFSTVCCTNSELLKSPTCDTVRVTTRPSTTC